MLEQKDSLERAIWMRQYATFGAEGKKHGRFTWLTLPDQTKCITIDDIVQQPTADARAEMVAAYVKNVWCTWKAVHLDTFAAWYAEFVAD